MTVRSRRSVRCIDASGFSNGAASDPIHAACGSPHDRAHDAGGDSRRAAVGDLAWADDRAQVAEDAVPPPESTAPVPEPRLALSTQLLSMRRSASELSRDLNLAAFETAVEPLTDSVNERSCVAVSLDGVVAGAANSSLAVIPASNQKILVAAVAEEILGPDYVYTTTVVGAEPVNGVIAGDVYLVGGGDPLLSGDWYPESELDRYPTFNATSIDALAAQLSAAGVTQITGVVRGDGSRYDDEFYAPGWGEGVAGLEAGPVRRTARQRRPGAW